MVPAYPADDVRVDSCFAVLMFAGRRQRGSENGLQAGETVKTGIIAGQILDGADGEIHYSYYIPADYDENRMYPLMVTMPGYDMMWFGDDSSGANLNWEGFRVWTERDEDMIVVSAQLTDWAKHRPGRRWS